MNPYIDNNSSLLIDTHRLIHSAAYAYERQSYQQAIHKLHRAIHHIDTLLNEQQTTHDSALYALKLLKEHTEQQLSEVQQHIHTYTVPPSSSSHSSSEGELNDFLSALKFLHLTIDKIYLSRMEYSRIKSVLTQIVDSTGKHDREDIKLEQRRLIEELDRLLLQSVKPVPVPSSTSTTSASSSSSKECLLHSKHISMLQRQVESERDATAKANDVAAKANERANKYRQTIEAAKMRSQLKQQSTAIKDR